MTDIELQSSTTLHDAPSELKEALRPLIECACQISSLPLIVSGPQGEVLATSRDPGGVCAVSSGSAELKQADTGEWRCPVTQCPHHGDFHYRELYLGSLPVAVAHCQGDDKLHVFAELVRSSLANHHDKSCLLEELTRVYEEINWLYNLGHILKKADNQQFTFEEVFKHVADLLPIREAEVWVPDRDAGIYHCLVRYDGHGLSRNLESVERSEESDHLLQHSGLRVLRDRFPQKDDLDRLLFALGQGLELPLVVLPLEAKAEFLGVLLIGLADYSTLSSSQVRLLDALGRQVGVCVHLRLLLEELRANEGFKRELEIARDIQHSLLPQETPRHPSYDLFAGCVTAAHVGGDYYDFFEQGEELMILIADVSGHSVGSGLIAMSFRSCFRHFLDMGMTLDELLRRVNATLWRELRNSGHFLSAFLCSFSPQSRQLHFVNAGHNRPFVLKARTEEFVDLEEAGLLIGVLENSSYVIGETCLEAGDILILYTDGIVEAENQNNEMFGVERFKSAVRKYRTRSAKALYHYLLKEMYVFQDEQVNKDDVTLAVMKVS